ncbi:hypothetical protein PG988_012307 [Apiospora saccharicola]
MEEDEGLREIHQVLQCYFENDTRRRFQLEGPIASGADSIAWGVQQTTCGQACQRIVLKTPKWADLGGEEEEEAPDGDCNTWNNESNPPDPIENEKKWLGVLRWAKHVMNIVEIPDDPLNRRKSPLRRHGVENWMFLEWVQHGTLHRLVRRAKEENIEYLPNRMLWRFFMCQSAVVASGLGGGAHNLAVMIGPFEPNPEYPEHDITPVLKMIDLGKMSGNEGTNFDATKENIRDIGNLMHELCTLLNPWERSDLYDGRETAEFQPPTPISNTTTPIQTEAVALLLLPPQHSPTKENEISCPRLDPDLRVLVCSCLAVRPEFRPGLVELFQGVMEVIHVWDVAWYASEGAGFCDPTMETDDSIAEHRREDELLLFWVTLRFHDCPLAIHCSLEEAVANELENLDAVLVCRDPQNERCSAAWKHKNAVAWLRIKRTPSYTAIVRSEGFPSGGECLEDHVEACV